VTGDVELNYPTQ